MNNAINITPFVLGFFLGGAIWYGCYMVTNALDRNTRTTRELIAILERQEENT